MPSDSPCSVEAEEKSPLPDDRLDGLLGKQIILDVSGRYVIAGTLQRFDRHFLDLAEVDVHDLRDSSSTRERYVLEVARLGIRPNREHTLVPREQVMCVTRLEHIIV